MTGFSEEQLAELRKPLSRDHVKQRPQAGRTLSYVEGWHLIDEANRIFGFDAWDRETFDLRSVAEHQTKIGPAFDRQGNPLQQRDGWRVGYICRARIIVRTEVSTIIREGTGYGSGIDADLGAAHESAAKEAETDATKRSLMMFGYPFGLALYDKEQANVEAPARPASKLPPAEPRNAAAQAPASTTANGVPVMTDTAQLTLSAIRDAIVKAIDLADTPDRVEGILRVHAHDIAQLRAASVPTYNRIIGLANGRATTLGGELEGWELAP